MAVHFGTQVEADLDGIWAYVAKQSGSVDVANRVIDSITDHFFLLSRHPQLGRRRDDDLRPGLRSRVSQRIRDHLPHRESGCFDSSRRTWTPRHSSPALSFWISANQNKQHSEITNNNFPKDSVVK